MSITQKIPVSVKRRIRRAQEAVRRQVMRPFRQRGLRPALEEIVRTAPQPPSDAMLERLIAAWDNPAAGDPDYLRAVIDLCRDADGPILECGSGLTTFLLAAYSSDPVWTLEADERWHARVVKEAAAVGLPTSTIRFAPLKDYGEFFWYVVPDDLPDSFGLVVCDGPAAGGLKGGRKGLFPVLSGSIPSGAAVVIDAGMVHEQVAVAAWEADHGLTTVDLTTPHRIYRVP